MTFSVSLRAGLGEQMLPRFTLSGSHAVICWFAAQITSMTESKTGQVTEGNDLLYLH